MPIDGGKYVKTNIFFLLEGKMFSILSGKVCGFSIRLSYTPVFMGGPSDDPGYVILHPLSQNRGYLLVSCVPVTHIQTDGRQPLYDTLQVVSRPSII